MRLLLDLFCGAGGCSKGYADAGYKVVGVDRDPHPDYPFEFVQADAMTFDLDGFDAVHASPPCQAFTRASHLRKAQGRNDNTIDLLTPTIARFRQLDVPWVVENVPGAPGMEGAITLCGSMFGLAVQRHRLFLSNVPLSPPSKCDHKSFPPDEVTGKPRPIGVYYRTGETIPHGGRTAKNIAEGRWAMGIDWMKWDDLKESIPPKYTEHIGRQLLAVSQ